MVSNTISISHESVLTEVLENYNRDFVYTTVTESLNNRLRVYDVPLPNIVSSLEESFISDKEQLGDQESVIAAIRLEVYEQIIKLICDFYNVAFDDSVAPVSNLYLSAVYMYEFFISSFQKNIVVFFTNYILKEKVGLFEMLDLINRKKNKDISTAYAKNNIRNPKLAIISANLEYVIEQVCCTFDITFERYITLVYGSNTPITKHLLMVLMPQLDFFKTYVAPLFALNSQFRSILITDIRLSLQQQITLQDDANINKYIKEE